MTETRFWTKSFQRAGWAEIHVNVTEESDQQVTVALVNSSARNVFVINLVRSRAAVSSSRGMERRFIGAILVLEHTSREAFLSSSIGILT